MIPIEGFVVRYHRRNIQDLQDASDGRPQQETQHEFEVCVSGTKKRWALLNIRLSNDAYEDELPKFLKEFRQVDFDDAVLKWAVRRIDNDTRAGLIGSDDAWIELNSDDFELLRELSAKKNCDYQFRDGRESFCSASADPKGIQRGLRVLAPTSAPACKGCSLPDGSYLCTHLSHPKIASPRFGDRTVVSAQCDLSQVEISEPSLCHASQNSCWEHLILPSEGDRPPAYVPPALSRAFDYLEMTWRLRFGDQPLLARTCMESASALERDCATEQDFGDRLRGFADLLDALKVPDEILGSIKEGEREQLRYSLNRFERGLREKVQDEDRLAQGLNALKILRAAKNLRNSASHGGYTVRARIQAEVALGIDFYPRASWRATWDQLRARITRALHMIAEAVRTS